MRHLPVRVLVADADIVSRKNTTWHLEDAGHSVIPASCAGEVLLQCEVDPPDVMIIDLHLRDMDGYDLCSRLRCDPCTSEIPIIVTTAAEDEMTRTYLAKMVDYAGGDFFVTKPCDVNVLVQLVADLTPTSTNAAGGSAPPPEARVTWRGGSSQQLSSSR